MCVELQQGSWGGMKSSLGSKSSFKTRCARKQTGGHSKRNISIYYSSELLRCFQMSCSVQPSQVWVNVWENSLGYRRESLPLLSCNSSAIIAPPYTMRLGHLVSEGSFYQEIIDDYRQISNLVQIQRIPILISLPHRIPDITILHACSAVFCFSPFMSMCV